MTMLRTDQATAALPREDGAAPLTARQEWRRYWPMVLASFIGLGMPIMPFYSLGLFLDPLQTEFGWNRTLATVGSSIAALMAIPVSPFIGALIDRWGTRKFVLAGLVLTGGTMASFGLANGSAAQWITLWSIYAVVALFLKSTVWTAAIGHAFSAGRSLALAITLSGSALASTIVPPVARWLIDDYGWRQAYFWLSAGYTLPALVLAFFFVHDVRRRRGVADTAAVDESHDGSHVPGLTVKQALRSLPLLRIALATLFTLLITGVLIVHKVPILQEAGVTREHAALLASLSGVASIVGSLVTAWLMTRFDPGLIGGLTNLLMAVALVPLIGHLQSPAMIVASMLFVGYAGGTKLQVCAYLTSMYGGMRNYGKIFGVMASIIAFTGAIGPVLGGIVYDVSGGYSILIWVGVVASAISGLLLFRLGPIPDWDRTEPNRGLRSTEGQVA